MSLMKGREWVLEVDIQEYFDSIDHEKLIDFVAERIADGRILRLIRKMLKSGVMEDTLLKAQVAYQRNSHACFQFGLSTKVCHQAYPFDCIDNHILLYNLHSYHNPRNPQDKPES